MKTTPSRPPSLEEIEEVAQAREEQREAMMQQALKVLQSGREVQLIDLAAAGTTATPLTNELASLKEEYECMRQAGLELRAQIETLKSEGQEARELRRAFADWAGIGVELGHLPGIVMSTIRALVLERDAAKTRAADRDGLLAELERKSKNHRAWEIDARTAQAEAESWRATGQQFTDLFDPLKPANTSPASFWAVAQGVKSANVSLREERDSEKARAETAEAQVKRLRASLEVAVTKAVDIATIVNYDAPEEMERMEWVKSCRTVLAETAGKP